MFTVSQCENSAKQRTLISEISLFCPFQPVIARVEHSRRWDHNPSAVKSLYNNKGEYRSSKGNTPALNWDRRVLGETRNGVIALGTRRIAALIPGVTRGIDT